MIVLGRHVNKKNNPLSVDLYKQPGLQRKQHHLMSSKRESSAVISNVHFIIEQIMRYLSKVYYTDRTKKGTDRVFSYK